MKSLGPLQNVKGMTYAECARQFVPHTVREKQIKEMCQLVCDNQSKMKCPCPSPLSCQLITIARNRPDEDPNAEVS